MELATQAQLREAREARQKTPLVENLLQWGMVAYAYEEEGGDHYLLLSAWPQVDRAVYERHREYTWDVDPEILGHGPPPPGSDRIAIDDCEGFATIAVAGHRTAGRRAWQACQEFRGPLQRLKGWHALFVVELPVGVYHVAEIPWPEKALFVFDYPSPCRPAEGFRLALVDLAWWGGMPRRREGRWNRSSVTTWWQQSPPPQLGEVHGKVEQPRTVGPRRW